MSAPRYIPLTDLRERYGAGVDALARRFEAAGIQLYDLRPGGAYRKLAVAEADANALAQPLKRRPAPTPTLFREPTRDDVHRKLAALGYRG